MNTHSTTEQRAAQDDLMIREVRRCNETQERGFPSFLYGKDEKRRAARLVREGRLTSAESVEDGRCRDYWAV